MIKIKVFYGDTPLYIADLYQLCISDGYMYTLSEWEWFGHRFPSVDSAIDFAESYLCGKRYLFEGVE